MRALWLRISLKRAEKAGEEKILLAIGKIVEVIFSTLLRLQEKSFSINEFNLSVWWEKKNILFFRSALQIISSRPRFVLLAAAVRATRGRSSRYLRPQAANFQRQWNDFANLKQPSRFASSFRFDAALFYPSSIFFKKNECRRSHLQSRWIRRVQVLAIWGEL